MTDILSKIDSRLTELGLSNSEDIARLFEELRNAFDGENKEPIQPNSWEELRIRWLGRSEKSIRRRVLANWVKTESPFRNQTGAHFQETLSDTGYVAQKLRERRAAWEAVPAIAQQPGEYITSLYSTYIPSRAGAATESVFVPEDLSLPGVRRPIGSRHLIRQTQEELERIFLSIGFSVVEGPEIETPYYNFEALNIPEHHPARDTMDTFYLDLPKGAQPCLLRTHTSPVQIRTMEKQQPPVRIVVPGKVYRRDNPDSTHSFMFHQLEGLAVDTDITFCDFKGTIDYLAKQFFGPKIRTRLRPSYFQFTEPSAEVDGSCHVCDGSGCRVCKHTGWIELFGAGMVNPAVYGFVNYDAKRLSGFAFGIGIDRFAMLKYGIDDLQLFFQNDVRFLRQFP